MLQRTFTSALAASVSLLAIGSAATAAEAADSSGPTAMSEVVVTAAPREEEKARQVQLSAPVIVNVQSAETIAKYPDYNAAESLGVSRVSLCPATRAKDASSTSGKSTPT